MEKEENKKNLENDTLEIETIQDEIVKKKEKRKKVIKTIIILVIVFTGFISWARFISTKGLVLNEYPIKDSNLPAEYDGLKIIHFTDVHYGSTIHLKELKTLVKEINKQKPDIVVFTGDLFDQNAKLNDNQLIEAVNVINQIKPTLEFYAVIGNHDYDTDYWKKTVDKLNFTVLDNTYDFVYKNSNTPIIFVGLDDLLNGTPNYENAYSYLNEVDSNNYVITIAHEPDQIDKVSKYNIGLFLAGHSHLGQVRLPYIGAIYTPKGSRKYYDSYYEVNNTKLYISGGIGTSGLKLRFFNKPSINLYRFYTK